MTMVYNSEEACIIYEGNKEYAYLAIEGYMDTRKIREFSYRLIDLCRNSTMKAALCDTSKIKVIRPNDIQWIIQQVIPELRVSCLKKAALILPENAFGQLAVKEIAGKFNNCRVRLFQNMESAEEWLFMSENTLSGIA